MDYIVLWIVAIVAVCWVYKSWRDRKNGEHNLAVADARKELFDELNFVPSRDMELNSRMSIWFDDESNRIAFSTPGDYILVADYGTVAGHELKENGRTSFSGSMDSAVGGAIVGKALFDNATAGAVVGVAGTSFSEEKSCSSMVLALKFDDIKTPYVEIPLLEGELDCDSAEYAVLRRKAGELSALFDLVERRKAERKLKGGKVMSYGVHGE